MKCKNCYSNLPDHSRFCKYCGCSLNDIPQQPVQNFTLQPEVIPDSPKNNKIPIISLAVFAGILLLLLNFLFSARIGFSSDIVKNRVSSLNMEKILDSEFEEGISAAEYIYDNMDSHFLDNTGAKSKDLRSFLSRCNIEEFLAVKLSEYSAYIIEGSDIEPSLDAHSITNFVYSRRNLFTEELDYIMDQTDYRELEKSLVDAGIDDALSIKGLSKSAGFNLNHAHYFLSFITLIVIFLIICGSFFGILMLNKNKIHGAFSCIGIPLIAIGAVSAIPAIVFFICMLASEGTTISYIVSGIANPFAVFLLCTGIFEVVAGVILLILKKFLGKSTS